MLEGVEEAHRAGLEEPGALHDGQGHGQHQRRVTQAAQELGVMTGPQQPPQGEEHDLVVLPVVQQLLDHLAGDVRVDAVHGHIENLDPFYSSLRRYPRVSLLKYRFDSTEGIQGGGFHAQHVSAEMHGLEAGALQSSSPHRPERPPSGPMRMLTDPGHPGQQLVQRRTSPRGCSWKNSAVSHVRAALSH